MINNITQLIEENWELLPADGPLSNTESLSFTKFCQRIVSHNTKVLFLVTYKNNPICIVKTVRDPVFNEKLKNEKRAQERFPKFGELHVPRVYFDGLIDGRYVYAEEAVTGSLISKNLARMMEGNIIKSLSSLPVYNNIKTEEISEILYRHTPREDENIQNLIECIRDKKLVLKKGFTHGDFGRPNIINNSGKLYIIDWERAEELPIWLIDAVYFMVKNRNISNLEEWKQKASSDFAEYAGIDNKMTEVLFCTLVALMIFRKRYPNKYADVIKELS